MVKTQEEIYKYVKGGIDPYFDFRMQCLGPFLSYDYIKEWLNDGARAESESGGKVWKSVPLNEGAILAQMEGHMPFAWDNCLGERGLSASRSVDRFGHWIWALGNDSDWKTYLDENYGWYGDNQLRWVCERYNFPIPAERLAFIGRGPSRVCDFI